MKQLRNLTRTAGLLVLILVLLPVGSGTAAGHGGGLEPSASLPRIVAVEPAVPGLSVEVIEAGGRLRIVNDTPVTVDVAPQGSVRQREPIVPPGATARWHDARIDAAGRTRPAEGGSAWTIPLTVGDQAVTVRGEQVWPPAPPAVLWWLATAVAALVTAAVGMAALRRRPAAVATAGITGLVIGAHVVHALGAALVPEDQNYLVVVLGVAGIGLGAWLAGVMGAALTLAGRRFGLLLCALAGAILAMVTAFDTISFASAVLPFGWSPDLDRATTVLTFGAGIGLFLTGFAVLRDLTPVPPDGERSRGEQPAGPQPAGP